MPEPNQKNVREAWTARSSIIRTEWITIRFQHSRDLLQQVDMILLGKASRIWEWEHYLLPEKKKT